MGETETRFYPVQIRYVRPPELDLKDRPARRTLHGGEPESRLGLQSERSDTPADGYLIGAPIAW
jgi:hypothetical protein